MCPHGLDLSHLAVDLIAWAVAWIPLVKNIDWRKYID